MILNSDEKRAIEGSKITNSCLSTPPQSLRDHFAALSTKNNGETKTNKNTRSWIRNQPSYLLRVVCSSFDFAVVFKVLVVLVSKNDERRVVSRNF